MRNERILEIAGFPPISDISVRIIPGYQKPIIGLNWYTHFQKRIVTVGLKWLCLNYVEPEREPICVSKMLYHN